MKKVIFYTDIMGVLGVEAVNNNYILLSYFIEEHTSIDYIQRTIDEFRIVQSGEKTFEEVFEEKYGTIAISYDAGEMECDKDTVYFISNHPDLEPSLEMPLQELIDLLVEWKAFREQRRIE
jgi:hypothetical protein